MKRELRLQVLTIRLNRLDAQSEAASDCACAHSRAEQPKHFQLTISEARELSVFFAWSLTQELSGKPSCHQRTEISIASQNTPDRRQNRFARLFLRDVASRSSA